jgi:hypothetical protein
MGISGLLPVLKSITETKSIDEYRGKTLAIDGYCWYGASPRKDDPSLDLYLTCFPPLSARLQAPPRHLLMQPGNMPRTGDGQVRSCPLRLRPYQLYLE